MTRQLSRHSCSRVFSPSASELNRSSTWADPKPTAARATTPSSNAPNASDERRVAGDALAGGQVVEAHEQQHRERQRDDRPARQRRGRAGAQKIMPSIQPTRFIAVGR